MSVRCALRFIIRIHNIVSIFFNKSLFKKFGLRRPHRMVAQFAISVPYAMLDASWFDTHIRSHGSAMLCHVYLRNVFFFIDRFLDVNDNGATIAFDYSENVTYEYVVNCLGLIDFHVSRKKYIYLDARYIFVKTNICIYLYYRTTTNFVRCFRWVCAENFYDVLLYGMWKLDPRNLSAAL